MSTNSMVARKTDAGYECIYVHWDGYLEGVGQTLLDTFNTDEKVAELIALGDCSSIVDAKSLANVKAYHRDKNEDWDLVKPEHFATLHEALDYYSNPFSYVWGDDKKWSAYYADEELAWNK